jgi:Domain of unknown function (DUF4349)
MTMLDDDRLAALLGEAAAMFDVPANGPEDILEGAAGHTTVRRAGDDGAQSDAVGDGDADGDDGDVGSDDARPGDASEPMGRVARLHRLTVLAARHRSLSVAAGVLVLLAAAGTVVAVARGPARPASTTALSHTAVTAPSRAPVTTTTAPSGTAAVGATQNAAAPFSAAHAPTSGKSATPTTVPALPSGAVGQSAKVEQTGSLSLTVGRGTLSSTVTQLSALAGAYGGFVANSQTQSGATTGGAPSGSVTLQVPVQSFSTVLTRAEALGKTSGLTTKATDVTGQYVDLQARISALQDSRQQYLTILAKATTVGDVLAVQQQIDGLQSQIEQLQGQLQLLSSQTTYSTLTVTVNEHTSVPAPAPKRLPESGLVRAWHASIGGFVSGVEGLVRLAGPVVFALLLLGAALAGGRAVWRRLQRRNL